MDDPFARPDPAHLPAAYWFWHRLPTDDEIVRQVGELDEAGIRSFQIQARLAYPMAGYLDPGYLRACAVAVAEAAARHLTVGIYDDYNWQSGHAGGRTVAGADHLRERHIFWTRAAAGGSGARARVSGITSSTESLGEAGMNWHYEGGEVRFDEWELLAAVAAPPGDHVAAQLRDVSAAARIVAASPGGCTLELDAGALAAAGASGVAGLDVTFFVSARCVTSRLPSYLLEEAARRFVEVGLEPFHDAFGEHFGKTVSYLFFDQPHANFYSWAEHVGNLRSSLPFAPALREAVELATSTPFPLLLAALVDDLGEDTARLRAGFYEAFTGLACRVWLGTLRQWCEQRRIGLSGHEVLGHVGSWHPAASFAGWDLRVHFGLDYFGVDSFRTLTGADAQDCVPQLSTKLGDSVARSNGRSGCIVEQYLAGRTEGRGAWTGAWGLSLEELRAQALRLELLGARQFLYHGFYQTDGNGEDFRRLVNPRFDFPPGLNFEPWWPWFAELAEEAGRLSVFLDGAEPACDVAVLWPLRTAWVEGGGHAFGDHVAAWAEGLALAGAGYHLVDERDLLAAETSDGLLLGSRRYPCLVLPAVTTLRSAASLDALAAFVAGGGELVTSGETPRRLQLGDGEEAVARFARLAAAGEGVRHLERPPSVEEIAALVAPLLARRPHLHRRGGRATWQWAGREPSSEGIWRLAAFNDTKAVVGAELSLSPVDVEVQRWSASSGERSPWQHAEGAEGADTALVPVALQPMELALFRVRPAPAGRAALRTPLVAAPAPGPGGPSREIVLDEGWMLELPAGSGLSVPIRTDRGWEQQGFATVSGTGRYHLGLRLPAVRGAVLELPAVHCAVEARLDGVVLGRRGWSPYRFEIPARLLCGDGTVHELTLLVASAAGNRYYAGTPFDDGPEPSGLSAPPRLLVT